MVLSKSCIYGIQSAIYVSANSGADYVQINKIAEHLNISFHFLTKVLQQFTAAGIMLSYRGPKGGVALARPSAHITLFDLIKATDGDEMFTECMLGLPGCGHAEPCPAHDHWVEVRTKFAQIARKTTLADLAKKANELNVRLANAHLKPPGRPIPTA
jgi:Rrf2 family transcriptional regulator, iron-sulfur cluster assembly transcription factor